MDKKLTVTLIIACLAAGLIAVPISSATVYNDYHVEYWQNSKAGYVQQVILAHDYSQFNYTMDLQNAVTQITFSGMYMANSTIWDQNTKQGYALVYLMYGSGTGQHPGGESVQLYYQNDYWNDGPRELVANISGSPEYDIKSASLIYDGDFMALYVNGAFKALDHNKQNGTTFDTIDHHIRNVEATVPTYIYGYLTGWWGVPDPTPPPTNPPPNQWGGYNDFHDWTYTAAPNQKYTMTRAYDAKIDYQLGMSDATTNSIYELNIGFIDSTNSGNYLELRQTGTGATQAFLWQVLNGDKMHLVALANVTGTASDYINNAEVSYDGGTATVKVNDQTLYTQNVVGAKLKYIDVTTESYDITVTGNTHLDLTGYWGTLPPAGTNPDPTHPPANGGSSGDFFGTINTNMPLIVVALVLIAIIFGAGLLFAKIKGIGQTALKVA